MPAETWPGWLESRASLSAGDGADRHRVSGFGLAEILVVVLAGVSLAATFHL